MKASRQQNVKLRNERQGLYRLMVLTAATSGMWSQYARGHDEAAVIFASNTWQNGTQWIGADTARGSNSCPGDCACLARDCARNDDPAGFRKLFANGFNGVSLSAGHVVRRVEVNVKGRYETTNSGGGLKVDIVLRNAAGQEVRRETRVTQMFSWNGGCRWRLPDNLANITDWADWTSDPGAIGRIEMAVWRNESQADLWIEAFQVTIWSGCAVDWNGDGVCDSPECPPDYIGDGYCDVECCIPQNGYDGGDCLPDCSPPPPDCPVDYIGDGYCDVECCSPQNGYDGGDCLPDCSPATPDCPDDYIGDGYCDVECCSPQNGYDGGDCLPDCSPATPDCPLDYIGDGYCDVECCSPQNGYDGGDCLPDCSPNPCPPLSIGDGYCDENCSTRENGYDGGDCAVLGDMNCDSQLDQRDLSAFVMALTNPVSYAQVFPACDLHRGDFNDNGRVDGTDIPGLARALLR